MENQKIFINDHEAVDLGLSVKWATCNIGACKPEERGDYFAWGETSPKDVYTGETYLYYDVANNQKFIDIGTEISGTEYDAARKQWGDEWRMPRLVEVEELIDECTWEPMKIGELCVCKITGKNGNSIFLPTDEEFYGHFYTSQYRIDTSDGEYECDGECYLSCHSGSSYVNVTGGDEVQHCQFDQ